jgi:hypothetical protein
MINKQPNKILEKGYRPIGQVNIKNPPKGGSGVPSKPFNQTLSSNEK